MKVSKNSKYQTHEKPKRPNWRARCPLAGPRRARRGTHSQFLTSIVAKHQKIEGGPFGEFFFGKKSHNAEETERGTLWDFSTSILSQYIKKLKGALWGIFFEKKSHNAEKTESF